MGENKKNPNRLMHYMIMVSLIIHFFIFMHISGLYRSEAMSYIEMAMQDISKPFSRSIPRPRIRPKPPEIRDIKKIRVRKPMIPQMKIDPVDNNFADNLMEGISTPDIPDYSSDWNFGGNDGFSTKKDYFEMIRLKIESRKKYPDAAKSRHIEGRVKIRFVITKDGQVSSLKIIKHARDNSLDSAASNAVRDAAPFPVPPSKLFNEALNMEITIVFELR